MCLRGLVKCQAGLLTELMTKTLKSCGDNHFYLINLKYDALNENCQHVALIGMPTLNRS